MTDQPSLELAVWREVSRHLDIAESVARIEPLVRRALPAGGVVLRRFDVTRARLETVAHGGPFAFGAATARHDLGPAELARFLAFAAKGRVQRVASPDDPLVAFAALGASDTGLVVAPLRDDSGPLGTVALAAIARPFDDADLAAIQALLEPLAVALANDARVHELARLRDAALADNRALLTRLGRPGILDTIVGADGGLAHVMERVAQVAPADVPVLILGETGSGKEVVARAIHEGSTRSKGPIVRINCGAIPPELVDSELFGHERGAFTGAAFARKGWFERADGGTLFLDEVGELPLAAQVRLLRVLQDGSLERVGGQRTLHVDVRIVAATHRDLHKLVSDGRFREDLWYRIGVFPLRLPALRERPEDLPALVAHFAARAGQRLGGGALTPTDGDLALLAAYAWPGNVRELQAVIDRAAILGHGVRLEVAAALGAAAPHVATPLVAAAQPAAPTDEPATLDAAMAAHIERTLARTRGRIEGPRGAAAVLGINPHTLRARMRKLRVDWSRFR